MHLFKRKSLNAKRITFVCSLLFYFIGVLTSCNSNTNQNKEITPALDSILNHANGLLPSKEPYLAVKHLDSMFLTIKNPSTLDNWYRYSFRFGYFLGYEKDILKSSLLLDSMFNTLENKHLIYKTEYASTLFSQGDLFSAKKNILLHLKPITMVGSLQRKTLTRVTSEILPAN